MFDIISYGFVEFRQERDGEYAMRVMGMTTLFNKLIRVNKSSMDKKVSLSVVFSSFFQIYSYFEPRQWMWEQIYFWET